MTYRLYCDGSASDSPPAGGWAYVLVAPDGSTFSGAGGGRDHSHTLEWRAAVEGLAAVPDGCDVVIYTDSKSVELGAAKLAAGRQPHGGEAWYHAAYLGHLRRLNSVRADWVDQRHPDYPTDHPHHRSAHHRAREARCA